VPLPVPSAVIVLLPAIPLFVGRNSRPEKAAVGCVGDEKRVQLATNGPKLPLQAVNVVRAVAADLCIAIMVGVTIQEAVLAPLPDNVEQRFR
jgi:hypothetical protein